MDLSTWQLGKNIDRKLKVLLMTDDYERSQQRRLLSPYPFVLDLPDGYESDFDSSAKIKKSHHIAAGKLVGEAMATGLFTPR